MDFGALSPISLGFGKPHTKSEIAKQLKGQNHLVLLAILSLVTIFPRIYLTLVATTSSLIKFQFVGSENTCELN